ncbi:MAG: nicotinate-nucleotide adenylyltransferase [Nitrospinota bacterium]
MRIGIMGGTFDPIHYGHLNSAEEIAEIFKIDQILFIPAFIQPHKRGEKTADAYHRLMMTLLATLSNPRFTVSTIEIEKRGYSYTIDTMKKLSKTLRRNTHFYFIAGIDAFKEISTWKDADRLLKSCDFIVSTRPGYRIDDLFKILSETVSKKYRGIRFKIEKKSSSLKSSRLSVIGSRTFIHTVETTPFDISSTEVRNRIRKGMTIKYLLPELVEDYIYKNELYV